MSNTLRSAAGSDVKFLWTLRNQPDVYKYFKTNKPVEWEDHIQWITPIINGERDIRLFIIECDNQPGGADKNGLWRRES